LVAFLTSIITYEKGHYKKHSDNSYISPPMDDNFGIKIAKIIKKGTKCARFAVDKTVINID